MFYCLGDKLVCDSVASRKEDVAKGPCLGEIFDDTPGANGYIWYFQRDLNMYNDNLLVNRTISIVHMDSNFLDKGQETKLLVDIHFKDGVVEELEKQILMDNRVNPWLDSCFGLLDTWQGTNMRKKPHTCLWEVMWNFRSLPLLISPGAPAISLGIQLIAEVLMEVSMFPEAFCPYGTSVCLKDLCAEIMEVYVYWLGVRLRREYSLLMHLCVAKLPVVFNYLGNVCLDLLPNLLSGQPLSCLVEESIIEKIMVIGNDASKLFMFLTNYNERGTGFMSTVLVALFQASVSTAVVLTPKYLIIFLVDTLFLKWFYMVVLKYDKDYFQHCLIAGKPITVFEGILGVLYSYCTVGIIQFMVTPKDDFSRHFQDLISFIDIELSIRIAPDKKSFTLPRICPIIGVASLCYGNIRISGRDYRKTTTLSYLQVQICNEFVAGTHFVDSLEAIYLVVQGLDATHSFQKNWTSVPTLQTGNSRSPTILLSQIATHIRTMTCSEQGLNGTTMVFDPGGRNFLRAISEIKDGVWCSILAHIEGAPTSYCSTLRARLLKGDGM